MVSLVSNREFRSDLKNGESFNINLSDFTLNLAGCVGQRIQTSQTVTKGWSSFADSSNKFDVTTTTGGAVHPTVIVQDAGNFEDDGFNIGDAIVITNLNGAAEEGPWEGTVTNVAADTLYADMDNTFTLSAVDQENIKVYGITPLSGHELSFGLNENSDTTEIYVSKLDNELQKFYVEGVGVKTGGTSLLPVRDTTPITMTPSGSVFSWLTGGATMEFVEYETITWNSVTFGINQKFKFVHFFIVLPYYQDGDIPNLQSLTPPALFASGNTLKYVFKVDMYRVLSDPNLVHTVKENTNLGSIGWFGQNFNGLANGYSITAYQLTDLATALPLAKVNGAGVTTFSITVENPGGPFVDLNSNFIVGISKLPEPDEYQNTVETYEENFLYDSKRNTVGLAADSSTIISNLSATIVSSTEIEITGRISYTVAQQLLLDSDAYYALWVIVEDHTKTNETTDRVALLVDVNQYIFSADVEDLMFVDESGYKIIPHYQTEIDTGFTDFKGWVEDGIEVIMPFQLNKDLSAELVEMNASLIAYNSVTGEKFEIQRYDFNLSGAVVASGIQNISINTTRGYKLVSGSIFNKVFVQNTGLGINGSYNVVNYDLKIGFKINHEQWLQLPDVDPVFYDASEPFDGFNKLTSRYSGLNNYEIKIALEARVSDGSSITEYQFLTPDFDVKYYHQPVVPKGWTCKVETFNQAGTDTSLNISDTENTKIKGTFSLDTGTVPGGLWATIHLMEFEGNIFNMYELSSIEASITNNPLVPLTGETQTKITVVGNDVFVECEIDYTRINPSKDYCISARLGSSELEDIFQVTIDSSFVGGAGGTWDMPITITDELGNYPGDGLEYTITFNDTDGPTVLGTIVYLTGDTIGVDAPQSTTGIGATFIPHMTGVITDGATLTLDKRTWGETEGFIDDALINNSASLQIDVVVTDGVIVSNVDSTILGIQTTEGIFDNPIDVSFVQGNLYVIADRNNGRIRLGNVNGKTKLVGTLTSCSGVCADPNDLSNGIPVIYATSFTTVSATTDIYEFRYDGTNFIKTLVHTPTTNGAFQLSCDENQVFSGKSALWLSTQRASSPANGPDDRLTLLEWDGVSAFNEHDFDLRMNDVMSPYSAATALIWQMHFQSSIMYAAVKLSGGENFIFRMNYLGGTYTNQANWSIDFMVGESAGNADGTGSAAAFNDVRGVAPIDGTADPDLFMTDALSNIANIRLLEYQAGTDNYASTKIIGGTTTGDQDGAGTSARFNLTRTLASNKGGVFIWVADSGNDKIYSLIIATNTSVTVHGTGSPGYEEEISY